MATSNGSLYLTAVLPVLLLAAPIVSAAAQNVPDPRKCRVTDHVEFNESSGPNFEFVAIGDSDIWGNGLRTEEKFRTLVHHWLERDYFQRKRHVRQWVWAHSGATLKPDGNPPNLPRSGDVDGSYPTVEEQAQCVMSTGPGGPPNPEDVDLILMDGCINDLPGPSIVDPSGGRSKPSSPPPLDPVAQVKWLAQNLSLDTGREWVKQRTATKCSAGGQPMAAVNGPLVATVLKRFPRAKVVVTGYQLLFSSRTEPHLLPQLYTTWDQWVTGLWARITTWSAGEAYLPVLRDIAAANALQFRDQTDQIFRAAVQQANETERPSRPRAVFVPLNAGNETAYGAGASSYLWPIPAPPAIDNMYSQRLPQCERELEDVGARAVCQYNTTAHPNVAGAQAYYRAIIQVLPALLKAPTIRATVTPSTAVQPWIPVTVRVTAYDADTNQPLNGTIQLAGQSFSTNTDKSIKFEPRRVLLAPGGRTRLDSTAEGTITVPRYDSGRILFNLRIPTLRVEPVYDPNAARTGKPIPITVRAIDAESGQPVRGKVLIPPYTNPNPPATNQQFMYALPVGVARSPTGDVAGSRTEMAFVEWWVVADNGHYSDTRVGNPEH